MHVQDLEPNLWYGLVVTIGNRVFGPIRSMERIPRRMQGDTSCVALSYTLPIVHCLCPQYLRKVDFYLTHTENPPWQQEGAFLATRGWTISTAHAQGRGSTETLA